MDIDLTHKSQLWNNKLSPFCFLAVRSKKHNSNLKKITFVNYMKMKKARPLIFSVSTYDSNMSMHTKNQFPGFIQFFWLYDQNNVFQTKKLICVNYRKMKKARLMISNMNTCHIYVSIHAKHQPPSFIHFFWAFCRKGIEKNITELYQNAETPKRRE